MPEPGQGLWEHLRPGRYSAQDPGKEGACPYLETSEGEGLAVNKREKSQGKEHRPWEGLRPADLWAEQRVRGRRPCTGTPRPARRVEAPGSSHRRTETRKGAGRRPGDGRCSRGGQPLLPVPRREQALGRTPRAEALTNPPGTRPAAPRRSRALARPRRHTQTA